MNVLITGANEGIGYYMATALLEQGNHVTVLDISIVQLERLKEQYPQSLLPIVCDVRSAESVEKAVQASIAAYDSIDIAVHNACRCTFETMEQTDYATYEDVFNVNYYGALRLTKSIVPHMEKAGAGKVIFTSSGVGVMGFPNISPYASTKGALETLAKCLNLEYADKGISFHIFQPPLTKTRSAAPLPVPEEFLADAKAVGYGLAANIHKKNYYICHSASQHFQTRLCYLFPNKMGKMMSLMLKRSQTEKK